VAERPTPKISRPWRRAIELAGAELHFVEDPLDRWRLIRAKSKSDGWFSATNICQPPTGSEPFGVEGYKTLACELAEDPQTAGADTILVTPESDCSTLPIAICMAAGLPIVSTVTRTAAELLEDRHTAVMTTKPQPRLIAQRILDEGNILFVFPEGTRSPDGALQAAQDGVAALATRTGAPIVPLGISGSNGVWPKGQKLPHPGGHVTIRIGRPFRPTELLPPGTDRRTAKGLVTTMIMERIAALLPPAQRGAYGGVGLAEDPATRTDGRATSGG
jgi:hypothetical protein